MAMIRCLTMWLVVMGLALWAASVLAADAPSPVYDIPRLDHITIDGKADAWGERGFRIDQLAPVDGRFLPAAEHDSHCRLGWTAEGLVVLVWVQQERWQESNDDAQLWTGDCIELYMAPEKGHESMCQWVVTPGMDAQHEQPRWHLNDFRRTPALKGLPADLQVVRTKTDHGCLVEVLLPWSALAIQPVVGREVGFQLWTTHYQPGKPDLYYAAWLPALGTFFVHQNVQRIRLAEAASPAVVTHAYGDYDLRAARGLITVTAPTAATGHTVTVNAGKRVLATGVLTANATGRAGAVFTLPPPPRGQPYKEVEAHCDGSLLATISLPYSDRLLEIAGLLKETDILKDTYRLDQPWEEMAGAPALLRRHRGMVAQAWNKLRNFGPDSVKDLQFFVEAAEMVQALDKGVDYLGQKRNGFWCAYYSQADGSGQPFVARVPKNFDPRKNYPLIVNLHGSGLRPAPDPTATVDKSYISVDAWGRGDNSFSALGDNDVMEVIRYMQRWYPIDANRIYIAGGSMGGYGAWAIASRHPDLFAAAATVCGWANGLPLENLRNVPVFDQHGRQDWMVSIDQSRWAVDRLRQLDYPVMAKEHPDEGHGILKPWPVDDWLLRQTRPEHPPVITFTCGSAAEGRAYWLAVRRFADPHQPVTLQARILGHGPGQSVSLRAPNAEVLELDTAGMGVDRQQALLLNIGMETLKAEAPLPEKLLLLQQNGIVKLADAWTPAEEGKRPYQPGGAANLYDGEPLLLVYGTQGSAEQVATLQHAAAQLAQYAGSGWRRMDIGGFPVKSDRDVTADDLQRYNVLLVGGPAQNALTARLLPGLPLNVDAQRQLVVPGRAPVSLADAVLGVCCVNPKAPRRLLALLWPDLDSPNASAWSDSPDGALPGLQVDNRMQAADLLVRAFGPANGPGKGGADRCRLQFTYGWQWQALPGADRRMPAELASARRQTELTAPLLRRGNGADYVLLPCPDNDERVYDPACFTWADFRVGATALQTLLGTVSGKELLDIRERFIVAKQELLAVPQIDPAAIDPARRYRLVMPVDATWTLKAREQNLSDVSAGPALLPEDVRAELEAQVGGERSEK